MEGEVNFYRISSGKTKPINKSGLFCSEARNINIVEIEFI